MKRKIFIIFLLIFVFLGINVNAASEEELNEYASLVRDEDEEICVFSPNSASKYKEQLYDAKESLMHPEASESIEYIVIGLKKRKDSGTNVYNATDYTLRVGSYSSRTEIHTIGAQKYYEEASTIELSSNNCSNYIVQVHHEYLETEYRHFFGIYLTYAPNGVPSDKEYYFQYNALKTNYVRNIFKIKQFQSDCILKFENERHQLSSYNKSKNYFATNIENYNICPATVENGYIFTRLYDNFKLDSFKCEDWKLAKNVNYFNAGHNQHPDCRFFLVDADSEIFDKEDTTLEEQGEYITKYLSNQSSNADVITITNVNGKLKAIQKNSKKEGEITISNLNSYTSTFLNRDEANYPTYITCNDNDCKFSNNKKDGKRAYIAMVKINSVLIGKEIALENCRDLFGSDFLEFLNNNVFKIVYIAIPILLILLTSFDFAKVVFIDDKEGIQGSFKKFGKRVIAAVLIYLIPTILIFVSNIFQNRKINSCAREFMENSEKAENSENSENN